MFDRQKAETNDRRPLIKLFLIAILLLLRLSVEAQGQFVYVNNGTAPNSVSGFRIDSDGMLTPVPGSPFEAGGVFGILNDFSNATIHVKGEYLFVCNAFSHTVSVFRINSDGSLAPVEGSPFASGGRLPIAVTTNPQGTLLFVTNNGTSNLSVFQIHPTGVLSPVSGSPFSVRPLLQPTGLAINSTGTLLMVGGRRALRIYRVNSDDGSIAAVGSQIETGLDTQALAITANDKYLYAAAVNMNAINGWKISTDGQLTPLPSYLLPSSSGALGLAVNPRGNLLFATVSGESAVHVFRIASTGALQSVSGSPFPTAGSEVKPISVNPSGDFVYAVDVINHLIHVFLINAFGVRLTEIDGSPFSTGTTLGRPTGLAFK